MQMEKTGEKYVWRMTLLALYRSKNVQFLERIVIFYVVFGVP